MTKAKMEEKGTPYKEKKTSSDSISSPGSSDNTSSTGNQSVVREKTIIFKKGGKNAVMKERNTSFTLVEKKEKFKKIKK
eukprot:9645411-Ditylum_brightwellii.AAC.1